MLVLYFKVPHQSLCDLQSIDYFLQASTGHRNFVKLCWFNYGINYLSDYQVLCRHTRKQPGAKINGLSFEVARLDLNHGFIIYHLGI